MALTTVSKTKASNIVKKPNTFNSYFTFSANAVEEWNEYNGICSDFSAVFSSLSCSFSRWYSNWTTRCRWPPTWRPSYRFLSLWPWRFVVAYNVSCCLRCHNFSANVAVRPWLPTCSLLHSPVPFGIWPKTLRYCRPVCHVVRWENFIFYFKPIKLIQCAVSIEIGPQRIAGHYEGTICGHQTCRSGNYEKYQSGFGQIQSRYDTDEKIDC